MLCAALLIDGPLSALAQRAAAAHVKVHGGASALSALAEALVVWGRRRKIFPPQAGIRTAELFAIVGAAVQRVVEEYRDGGGVLIAKGWLSPDDVMLAVAQQYWEDFAPPIPTTLHPKASNDEIVARSAVAAQAVAAVLRKWATHPETPISYPAELEEQLAVTLAKTALRAFLHPNESLHAALHGDPDAS